MLEMLGLKKKKVVELRGEELITDVVDKFRDMIHQLDDGIQGCISEKAGVDQAIASLETKRNGLSGSIVEGNRLSNKLSDLLT